MASVTDSIKVILANEGGYNCAFVGSGETYKGIDRNYSTNWQGWQIIDALKANGKLDSSCSRAGEQYIKSSLLDTLVNKWYTTQLLPYFKNNFGYIRNQLLANFIADFVWHKPYRAITIINSIVKQLAPNTTTSDNYLTPQVINVINANSSTVYKTLYQRRLQYYNNPASINSSWSEKFITTLNGLIKRVKKFPPTLNIWSWIL